MMDRFQRLKILIGDENFSKLSSATVAIFGIGGVGSFAAEALARSGVGHLILIDKDSIDATNIISDGGKLWIDFSGSKF